MRIAFFGTPDFAVPCLEALVSSGEEVVVAVTQPDKPKGRGRALQPPPVKALALAKGIPVRQPASVRKPPFVPELASFSPELAVVVAYGKILPKDLLEIPGQGCINVHASLLPRWRGAAPIQWAVLEGDEVSGVTTMFMDEGMDTGDMLLTREVRLRPDETAGSLFERLAPLGADALLETIASLKAGRLERRPQDPSRATHARMLTKEDGRIDWTRCAAEIERLVRGTSPWPGAFTTIPDRKLLKVHRVGVVDEGPAQAAPGQVVRRDSGGVFVRAGEGMVVLLEVQPEGGKRITGAEFARGRGAVLERLG